MHQVVIRGGLVVDGTGAPARRADAAIAGSRIVAVGDLDDPSAVTTVDASGCVVAPGFVDPHTHLDAQLCWDPAPAPVGAHGVTTVLIGMCGFGVAPCPPGGGEYLLRSLEVVEEIPFATTAQAVPFAWQSFGEYLAFLDRRPLAANVGAMVPHSALRYAVMGDRARAGAATPDEVDALTRALDDALTAGGLGLATSRGPNHNDAYGDPVPSRHATDDELRALVARLRGCPWQINVRTKFTPDPEPLLAETAEYARWTHDHGARLTWTPCFAEPDGVWRAVLRATAELRDGTVEIAPQICAQPLDTPLAFDRPGLLGIVPGWRAVFEGGGSAVAARLRDPDVRAALRAVPERPGEPFGPWYQAWTITRSPSRPDLVGRTLAAAAAAADVAPTDLLCDLAIADELATVVNVPVLNRDEEGVIALLNDPNTLVGLGDAGAHVMTVTNYSAPTTLLSELVRDRGAVPLERAIAHLTSIPARFFGLPGRGELVAGAAADVVVLDLARLRAEPHQVVHDLPGGAPRLHRGATGYRAVLVGGEAVWLDDAPTGARPGQVLRRTDSGAGRGSR